MRQLKDRCWKSLKIPKDLLKGLDWVNQQFILKLNLINFFKKYPALKKASLSSHCFRNNFKMIKTVCKNNEELFTWKKNRANGSINYFSCSVVRFFLLLWDICPVRLFISSWDFLFSLWDFIFPLWDFLFPRETFYFLARVFISLWDVLFFLPEFFSWKLFYPRWKSLANHKKRIWEAM